MNPDIKARSSVRRALTYILLLAIIGSVGYYIYYSVTDLLLPAQVQGPVDPLDDSGKGMDVPADVTSVGDPSFLQSQEEAQARISDAQKAKTLGIIKPNESISDAKKQQIMNELSGGRR
jgi:hypothetical protein